MRWVTASDTAPGGRVQWTMLPPATCGRKRISEPSGARTSWCSAGRPVAKGAVMGGTKYHKVSRLPTPMTMARNSRLRQTAGDPGAGEAAQRRAGHHGQGGRPDDDALADEHGDGDAVDQGRHAVLQRVGDAQLLEPGDGEAGQQHDAEPGAEIAAIDQAGHQDEHGPGVEPQAAGVTRPQAPDQGQQVRAEREQQRGDQQQPGNQRP